MASEWPAWVVLCDDRYRRANDPYDAFASEHFGPWRPSLNIEGGMYLHRDAARAWQAVRDFLNGTPEQWLASVDAAVGYAYAQGYNSGLHGLGMWR